MLAISRLMLDMAHVGEYSICHMYLLVFQNFYLGFKCFNFWDLIYLDFIFHTGDELFKSINEYSNLLCLKEIVIYGPQDKLDIMFYVLNFKKGLSPIFIYLFELPMLQILMMIQTTFISSRIYKMHSYQSLKANLKLLNQLKLIRFILIQELAVNGYFFLLKNYCKTT